jgi:hypothetical protein
MWYRPTAYGVHGHIVCFKVARLRGCAVFYSATLRNAMQWILNNAVYGYILDLEMCLWVDVVFYKRLENMCLFRTAVLYSIIISYLRILF